MILTGIVTQTSPIRVRIDGADTDSAAERLDVYTPTAGDRVALVRNGSRLLVIGKPTS